MDKEDKKTFDPKDSFVYRSERPWPVARLKRAAIVGHTTDCTAKIWVRTGACGNYKLIALPQNSGHDLSNRLQKDIQINDDELLTALRQSNGSSQENFQIADFANDTTCVIRLTGLQPQTAYRYFVFQKIPSPSAGAAWRVILGLDAIGNTGRRDLSFRTLGMKAEEPFSFALFSCHNPFVEEGFFSFQKRVKAANMEAWAALAQTLGRHGKRNDKRLAFVIAGGDQVYTDGRPGISIWNYLYKVMRKEGDKLLPEVGTMLTWFRDIYRGYWGFPDLREIFSHYPTYMIWDDHEIGDGWGSFDLPGGKLPHPIYEKARDKGLNQEDATELLRRMWSAAQEIYIEYEHSHNPDTPAGQFHYSFTHGAAAFFVLDGRGKRDINRSSYRIHGQEQMEALASFVKELDPAVHRFLFIVSPVPMLHTTDKIVSLEEGRLFSTVQLEALQEVRDDLRDGWEHPLHNEERRLCKNILWEAAARSIRVAILSGDVHASAVFRLEKAGIKLPIYQLTSSAITYHLAIYQQAIAKYILPAAEDGKTEDGETFTRLALSVKSPYSLVQIMPQSGEAIFQLYGIEKVPSHKNAAMTDLRSNSLARIELWKQGRE